MEVYKYRLKHDADDRITEKTETINGRSMTWTYVYDKKNRLHEAHLDGRLVCQCHYDKQGRRSQDYFPRTHGRDIRRYDYRMGNRLMQAGNNGYTHDKQGFRSIWNNEGKYTTYEYAPDYRLIKAIKEDKDVVFEFAHDENGQRSAKYRNGEHAREVEWLEKSREADGAAEAASAGALGGMVQSKGQGKGGKASGNDPRIDKFQKNFEKADPDRKQRLKKEFQKEIRELRKEASKATGKEKTRLQKRANQWAGALKVITDGKIRHGGPAILFDRRMIERALKGIPPRDIDMPDQT